VGKCTANKGDWILVAPGHVETIGGAAALNLDVAGITVQGIGQGDLMPTLNFTNTAGTVAVGADDITLRHLRFKCSIDSLVIGLDVNKADCWVDDCVFMESATNTNALIWIDVTGSGANQCDNFRLTNSSIRNEAAGATHAISIGAVHDNIQIVGNWIEGDFSTAAIGSGSILTNVLIADNYISNVNSGDWCIEFTDAATGLCVNNRFYADAVATTLDPGSMKCVNNRAVNAIDSADVAIPAPDTSAGTIEAALWGANGITTFPAAAVPGNGVSLAEVIRDIWDALRNGTGGAEPATNRSVMDYLGATPAFFVPGLGYKVTKTEDVNTATGDDLFDVTGKVLITVWTGEVTNALAAGVNDYKLRVKTDNVDLCAAGNIGSAAVGFLFQLSGDAGDSVINTASATNTADNNGKGLAGRIVGKAGGSCTLQSNRTAGDAGDAIVHTIFYLPLEASAAVAAAA
jgi:hypothetical protein